MVLSSDLVPSRSQGLRKSSHATEAKRTPAPPPPHANGKSLGEWAYDVILDRMLSREIPPGAMLQERSLGEALTRLESEGFVTRHAGRLLIVREIPVQELMQIFHVRSILEVEAVSLAAPRIDLDELATLRKLFETQKKKPLPDGGLHWDADDLLHGTIAAASGNQILADMVRALRRKTRMFNLKRMPERFLLGSDEHLAIIDALARRDERQARRAMATHIENSRRSVLKVLGDK
jgi:DNA-binding GntR family transcriptional regulator